MPVVQEFEATRDLVQEFIADCERVDASFGPRGAPSEGTGELVRWIRAKWDERAQSRGRRLSSSGRYGALVEAIVRLPRINRPREWSTKIFDARGTAKSCL
jgi:hypothetical protein